MLNAEVRGVVIEDRGVRNIFGRSVRHPNGRKSVVSADDFISAPGGPGINFVVGATVLYLPKGLTLSYSYVHNPSEEQNKFGSCPQVSGHAHATGQRPLPGRRFDQQLWDRLHILVEGCMCMN